MVSKKILKQQLKLTGFGFCFRGRAEIKELRSILRTDETIRQCVFGTYHGGSGLLVATDQRLLLVDKRPFFLNLEEIQYVDITNIEFHKHLLQAVVHLKAKGHRTIFRSISDARLKRVCIEVMRNSHINRAAVAAETGTNSTKRRRVFKPYLNPGWSPHHTGLIHRKRPTKFYQSSAVKPVAE